MKIEVKILLKKIKFYFISRNYVKLFVQFKQIIFYFKENTDRSVKNNLVLVLQIYFFHKKNKKTLCCTIKLHNFFNSDKRINQKISLPNRTETNCFLLKQIYFLTRRLFSLGAELYKISYGFLKRSLGER